MTEKLTTEEIKKLQNDPEFMAGVRRGLKARKEGKTIPWYQVKKELGL